MKKTTPAFTGKTCLRFLRRGENGSRKCFYLPNYFLYNFHSFKELFCKFINININTCYFKSECQCVFQSETGSPVSRNAGCTSHWMISKPLPAPYIGALQRLRNNRPRTLQSALHVQYGAVQNPAANRYYFQNLIFFKPSTRWQHFPYRRFSIFMVCFSTYPT